MEYTYSSSLSDLSNEDIVTHSWDAPCLSSDANSTKVVQILPDIVVKFGIGVRQNEATTQDFVFRHIDREILRVPGVYRFFTHGDFAGMPYGYIVMEHIAGSTLKKGRVGPDLIKRIINALNHLATLPMPASHGPGPVYGGIAQGSLWSEYGAGTSFTSMQGMETWLNQRLDLSSGKLPRFSLGSTKLQLCHMDVVRRNIILTDKDEICFIDWAHAGFYPGYFQRFCTEWCSVEDDTSFTRDILDQLPGQYNNGVEYLLGAVIRINSMYPPPGIERG
jgi:hypothetical protein